MVWIEDSASARVKQTDEQVLYEDVIVAGDAVIWIETTATWTASLLRYPGG